MSNQIYSCPLSFYVFYGKIKKTPCGKYTRTEEDINCNNISNCPYFRTYIKEENNESSNEINKKTIESLLSES